MTEVKAEDLEKAREFRARRCPHKKYGDVTPGLCDTCLAEFRRDARAEEREYKNAAYSERNCLVAFIASLYPSGLERHPDEDTTWEDDWRWVVYVDLPTGQASWHIHDSELGLFDHLPRAQGRKWDGHTTLAKYARLAQAIREGGGTDGK